MKANKLMKALAASAMSLALVAGMTAMPAMAIDVSIPNDEGTTTAITFTTTLDMANATGANVPAVTFDYSIAAGTAVDDDATNKEILAGVVDNISIGDAVFTAGGNATQTVTVNFSNVTFPHAGIYRYEITAIDPSDADITMDEDNTRTLDVYVTNKTGGGLEISYVVLMKDAVNLLQTGAYAGTVAKSEGFTNSYTTYDLTLDKVVVGTMGDKTKEFNFTINFTGGTQGETMTYGEQTITFGENGTASVTGIKLADSTAVATITGIPSGVSYTVVENIARNEGYTATATVQKGTGTATPATVTVADTTQTVAQQTMGKNDNAVVVTNTKNAVNPTGIILNVAPYALMVVIALAGVVVFLRKRVEE